MIVDQNPHGLSYARKRVSNRGEEEWAFGVLCLPSPFRLLHNCDEAGFQQTLQPAFCTDGRRARSAAGTSGSNATGEPAEMLSRFRDPDADVMSLDGVWAVLWHCTCLPFARLREEQAVYGDWGGVWLFSNGEKIVERQCSVASPLLIFIIF